MVLDMGGCLGLKPSGEVAGFTWDEPHRLATTTEPHMRNLVYYQASLKYPALAQLAPHRPADAIVCPSCGGSGKLIGLPERLASHVICECGGLGWISGEQAGGSGAAPGANPSSS